MILSIFYSLSSKFNFSKIDLKIKISNSLYTYFYVKFEKNIYIYINNTTENEINGTKFITDY